MEVTLSVTLQEANYIITKLGTLPYGEVKNLIEKIEAQTISQVEKQDLKKAKELVKK